MSETREYLEVKASEHPKEWLRREPRTTHPKILELVREFQAAGGFNNDAAESFICDRVGDLPAHRHHGANDRHRLINQLGHEVYLATQILSDERAQAELDEARAEGFVPLEEIELQDGGRYILKQGTLYSGRSVAAFSAGVRVRARKDGARFVFMLHGAKSRAFVPSGPALAKAA